MRLFTSGNELLDANAEGWTVVSNDGVNPWPGVNQPGGRQTPQKNGGRGYFSIPQNSRIQRQFFNPTNPEGPNILPTELYGRFAFNGNANTVGTRTIMILLDSNFVIIGEIIINDAGQPNTSTQLWQGDVYGSPSGAALVTAATNFDRSTWTTIEWHFKFAQVGGLAEVRINGGPIASFSGDVRGNIGQTQVAYIAFWNRTQNNGTANAYDDIVVNDTTGAINNSWPGDGYVMMLQPGRDGVLIPGGNKMTNDRGTNVDNASSARRQPIPAWADGSASPFSTALALPGPIGLVNTSNTLVNAFSLPGINVVVGPTDFAKTFVAPGVDGDKDSYRPSGILPLEVSGASAVSVMSLCATRDPKFAHLTHLLEFVGPSEQTGPQRSLPRDAPAWLTTSFNNNPQTAAAWTLTDLNNIEFGVRLNV